MINEEKNTFNSLKHVFCSPLLDVVVTGRLQYSLAGGKVMRDIWSAQIGFRETSHGTIDVSHREVKHGETILSPPRLTAQCVCVCVCVRVRVRVRVRVCVCVCSRQRVVITLIFMSQKVATKSK